MGARRSATREHRAADAGVPQGRLTYAMAPAWLILAYLLISAVSRDGSTRTVAGDCVGDIGVVVALSFWTRRTASSAHWLRMSGIAMISQNAERVSGPTANSRWDGAPSR